MKYQHLKQIASYLNNFKKITSIKRLNDMLLCICFDRQMLFFDLAKSGSKIYKFDDFKAIKEYNAPFDNICKKRLNNANLISCECLKNNRILRFDCVLNGSYKSVKTTLFLEFTGRFTNAIITDENGVILEALRHTTNDRKVQVGEILKPLGEFEIREKLVDEIADFDEFFKAEFEILNAQNLANLKAIKLASVEKKLEILNENLNALENEDELRKQSEILRQKASILLANLSNLNEFERNFTLFDFENKAVNFSLDDTPKNCANGFFNRAKKLTQKANNINIERENLAQKIGFYESLKRLLLNAKSTNELEILSPKTKQKRREGLENQNIKNFYIKEFKISIGRNEQGNVWLLKNSKKDDIWFHLKDLPSPHVIVKTNKSKIDDEILEFAAKICLNFSNVNQGRYEIDYTKRENVKIINGANVNYINFKTIILNKF